MRSRPSGRLVRGVGHVQTNSMTGCGRWSQRGRQAFADIGNSAGDASAQAAGRHGCRGDAGWSETARATDRLRRRVGAGVGDAAVRSTPLSSRRGDWLDASPDRRRDQPNVQTDVQIEGWGGEGEGRGPGRGGRDKPRGGPGTGAGQLRGRFGTGPGRAGGRKMPGRAEGDVRGPGTGDRGPGRAQGGVRGQGPERAEGEVRRRGPERADGEAPRARTSRRRGSRTEGRAV